MPDEIMAVNERLARLEVTVATGFSELCAEIGGVESRLRGEIGNLEERLRGEIVTATGTVESRLRVLIDASRDEQRLAAEGFGATLERIEARLSQMHQEYTETRDDHASAIQHHERRIIALERRHSDSTPAS
jgi:hypothetical protein